MGNICTHDAVAVNNPVLESEDSAAVGVPAREQPLINSSLGGNNRHHQQISSDALAEMRVLNNPVPGVMASALSERKAFDTKTMPKICKWPEHTATKDLARCLKAVAGNNA